MDSAGIRLQTEQARTWGGCLKGVVEFGVAQTKIIIEGLKRIGDDTTQKTKVLYKAAGLR